MIPNRRFRPEPMDALEAIAWLQSHRYVWYQAPMDYTPVKLHMKPGTKLKLWKRDPSRFQISTEYPAWNKLELLRLDNSHLDRLMLPFPLWHHGIEATVSHVDYVGQKHVIVLHQSNGYHLHMDSLCDAIVFAKRQAMKLTVQWGQRIRILVPAHPPISGEREF